MSAITLSTEKDEKFSGLPISLGDWGELVQKNYEYQYGKAECVKIGDYNCGNVVGEKTTLETYESYGSETETESVSAISKRTLQLAFKPSKKFKTEAQKRDLYVSLLVKHIEDITVTATVGGFVENGISASANASATITQFGKVQKEIVANISVTKGVVVIRATKRQKDTARQSLGGNRTAGASANFDPSKKQVGVNLSGNQSMQADVENTSETLTEEELATVRQTGELLKKVSHVWSYEAGVDKLTLTNEDSRIYTVTANVSATSTASTANTNSKAEVQTTGEWELQAKVMSENDVLFGTITGATFALLNDVPPRVRGGGVLASAAALAASGEDASGLLTLSDTAKLRREPVNPGAVRSVPQLQNNDARQVLTPSPLTRRSVPQSATIDSKLEKRVDGVSPQPSKATLLSET